MSQTKNTHLLLINNGLPRSVSQTPVSQELREQLVYMLVHDLRNPSATVMTIAEVLLRRGNVSGIVREGLQDILETIQRLNQRLDNLLAIGKATSEQPLLNPVHVDGIHLLQTVVNSLTAVAASKQCHIFTEFPAHPWPLTVDADLIHRVFENLIVNAIKFSPSGSQIRLKVVHPDSELNQGTVVQVIDEGYGLSELSKATIFEPFSVGDSVEGIAQTGLGLAFCKLAVEAHGGYILVEDNLPQGAIFSVIL